MTDYERQIHGMICPYNDKPCYDKIPCLRCRMDEYEIELIKRFDDTEIREDEK